MRNALLGIIAVSLLGIFIFLGMIFMGQENEQPDNVVADEKAESSIEVSTEQSRDLATEAVDDSSPDVPEDEGSTEASADISSKTSGEAENTVGAESLEKQLKGQDVTVEGEAYIIQDPEFKNLYPDMLSAIIKNNSTDDIRDVSYGFVAWDKNGLPVRLKGNIDFSNGSYFRGGTGEAVNVAPGETYGRDSGLEIDSEIDNIHSMKAVIVSYEGFNGENWENPYLNDFLEIYEGKRLGDIENHEDYIYYVNGTSSISANDSLDSDAGSEATMEAEAENFMMDYLGSLETAYAERNHSHIAGYFNTDTDAYNHIKTNIINNSFPNLTIFSSNVTSYNKVGNAIYLEITSERTHDDLEGIHTYVTAYDLTYLPESDTFKIESFQDL